MQEKSSHIEFESLIVRYLSGEADDKEKALLLDWLKQDPVHVQEFNRLRAVDEALKAKTHPSFDAEKAFAAFEQKMQKADNTIALPKRSSSKLWYTLSAVAAVALVVVGMFFFSNNKNQLNTIAYAGKSTKQIKLTDGTIAVLSPNSQITTEEDFGSNHRRVSIKGEVFFKVKHDAEKPFVIDVNGVQIQDVGTAFKVKVDSLSKNVSVRMQEGVVDFNFGGNKVTLHAGDFALADMNRNQILTGKLQTKKEQVEKPQDLSFEDVPLAQVVEKLNEKYHMNLVVETAELSNLKLNATFESSASVKEVKNILSLVLDVNITDVNGKQLVSKKDN